MPVCLVIPASSVVVGTMQILFWMGDVRPVLFLVVGVIIWILRCVWDVMKGFTLMEQLAKSATPFAKPVRTTKPAPPATKATT